MNFKEFDNFINNNKYNMLFFEIYYNLKCYDDETINKLTDEQKQKIIYLIHDAYLKDETHLDLGFICDKAIENKNEILNNEEFTRWDLLDKCYKEA